MKRIKAVHRWLPVAGVILFFIVVGNAAETTVSSKLANPAQFDGKTVTIQGTATAVKETTSRAGNDYATLQVQDPAGGTIKVFTWGHLSTKNVDRVEVTGVFQQIKRVGRYTFYNEIEAQSVRPLMH